MNGAFTLMSGDNREATYNNFGLTLEARAYVECMLMSVNPLRPEDAEGWREDAAYWNRLMDAKTSEVADCIFRAIYAYSHTPESSEPESTEVTPAELTVTPPAESSEPESTEVTPVDADKVARYAKAYDRHQWLAGLLQNAREAGNVTNELLLDYDRANNKLHRLAGELTPAEFAAFMAR